MVSEYWRRRPVQLPIRTYPLFGEQIYYLFTKRKIMDRSEVSKAPRDFATFNRALRESKGNGKMFCSVLHSFKRREREKSEEAEIALRCRWHILLALNILRSACYMFRFVGAKQLVITFEHRNVVFKHWPSRFTPTILLCKGPLKKTISLPGGSFYVVQRKKKTRSLFFLALVFVYCAVSFRLNDTPTISRVCV